jgi:hypothetical protein
MPTTQDRRWCVPLAIRWFERQTYDGPLELVVVSEHAAELAACFRGVNRVKVVSCLEGTTLGAKHNIAAVSASHPWLAKWDDDDWQSPIRLDTTMRAVQSAAADMVSGAPLLHYDLERKEAWEFCYASQRPWQPGNSLLVSRALWRRVRFDETRDRGIDSVFIHRALERHTAGLTVDRDVVTVALRHGQETGGGALNWDAPEWRRWRGDMRGLLGADLELIEEAYACKSPT